MTSQIYQQAVDAAAAKMAHDMDIELLMSLLGWNKIELNEGKVLGSRYATAKPVYDPTVTQGFNRSWDEAVTWCVEQFGPTKMPWETIGSKKLQRWYVNNSTFWFKNDEDLTLFLLRWA